MTIEITQSATKVTNDEVYVQLYFNLVNMFTTWGRTHRPAAAEIINKYMDEHRLFDEVEDFYRNKFPELIKRKPLLAKIETWEVTTIKKGYIEYKNTSYEYNQVRHYAFQSFANSLCDSWKQHKSKTKCINDYAAEQALTEQIHGFASTRLDFPKLEDYINSLPADEQDDACAFFKAIHEDIPWEALQVSRRQYFVLKAKYKEELKSFLGITQ